MSTMKSIDPGSLSSKESYRLLTRLVVPRPIAFVSTLAEDGTLNGAPFSYFNLVSVDPPLLSIAVNRPDESFKDTSRNIRERGEFVVHLVDKDNVEKVNETAANLPADQSEIEQAGLSPTPSEVVGVDAVEESPVRFECTLKHAIPLDKHGRVVGDLFIGKIERVHVRQKYEEGKTPELVARLGGEEYAEIGKTFTLKRPK